MIAEKYHYLNPDIRMHRAEFDPEDLDEKTANSVIGPIDVKDLDTYIELRDLLAADVTTLQYSYTPHRVAIFNSENGRAISFTATYRVDIHATIVKAGGVSGFLQDVLSGSFNHIVYTDYLKQYSDDKDFQEIVGVVREICSNTDFYRQLDVFTDINEVQRMLIRLEDNHKNKVNRGTNHLLAALCYGKISKIRTSINFIDTVALYWENIERDTQEELDFIEQWGKVLIYENNLLVDIVQDLNEDFSRVLGRYYYFERQS